MNGVHIGINPITWSNVEVPDLGGKFPRDTKVLGPIMERHGPALVSGWFDGRCAEKDMAEELEAIGPHLRLLKDMACRHVVYADTSFGRHGAIWDPISRRPTLADADWPAYGRKLTQLAEYMAEFGVRMAFHHHMGTIVETDAEVGLLMRHTGEAVGLLYDTGHCAFAGGDPLWLVKTHVKRIVDVHCKDVRKPMLDAARARDMSYMSAVLGGIFTVPCDGAIEYAPILRILKETGYTGWLVVEAEQDPKKAHPFTYAAMGYRNLSKLASQAGFNVIDHKEPVVSS